MQCRNSASTRNRLEKHPRNESGWGIVTLMVGLFLAVIAIPLIYALNKTSLPGSSINVEAKKIPEKAPHFVIGDLGGMPVAIPSHFAELVEYDGDPGFGEKRVGPMPQRSFQSKLRAFGFKVRLPDMAGLSSPELRSDYSKYSIYNTPWARVSVSTGGDFGDGQFLERSIHRINQWNKNIQYEKKPTLQYGLVTYSPTNVDPETRKIGRHIFDDKDWFTNFDKSGKVSTLIRCSNIQHDAAPCEHFFFLPPPLKAKITIGYRRGHLVQWKKTQSSVTGLIISFRVPAGSTTSR